VEISRGDRQTESPPLWAAYTAGRKVPEAAKVNEQRLESGVGGGGWRKSPRPCRYQGETNRRSRGRSREALERHRSF
jgi:hypothetical protein